MNSLHQFLALFILCLATTLSSAAGVNTDQVVLKNVASILQVEKNSLRPSLPFSEQRPPGDALDIVEIVMAIEDELQIEINDKELDAQVGATGVEDLPRKLTIRQLQRFVQNLYVRKSKLSKHS